MQPVPSHSSPRVPGIVLVLCAIATVALLAAHPGGGGGDFAAVLRSEAADQTKDAIIHGGFVVLLAIELVGFAALAVRVGASRTAVLAALVFTLVGSALLSGSMILDGLVTPAVAARYVAVPPEKQATAKVLFVLIGSTIRYLMPMGLAFLGAAALGWAAALLRKISSLGGVIALVAGGVVLLSAAALWTTMAPHLVFVGLGAYTLWVLAAGVLMIRGLKTVD